MAEAAGLLNFLEWKCVLWLAQGVCMPGLVPGGVTSSMHIWGIRGASPVSVRCLAILLYEWAGQSSICYVNGWVKITVGIYIGG